MGLFHVSILSTTALAHTLSSSEKLFATYVRNKSPVTQRTTLLSLVEIIGLPCIAMQSKNVTNISFFFRNRIFPIPPLVSAIPESMCFESLASIFGRFQGVVESHSFHLVNTVEQLSKNFYFTPF